MSELHKYQNVEKVESVSYKDSSESSPISNIIFTAVASLAVAAVDDLITGNISFKSKSLDTKEKNVQLKSPNNLRFSFAESYAKNMNYFAPQNIDSLAKRKKAIIKTLSEVPYYVENSSSISEKIVTVLNSDKHSFKSSVENAMNEIQNQHCTLFTKEMINIVSKASVDAGFKTVNVTIKNSISIISALDESGRGIVSELRTDNKSKMVDLVSETISITDNSCSSAIEKFSTALNKYGVKYTNAQQKWTGGNTWLQSAKEVQQSVSKNKINKQLERRRKLNSNIKKKI